MQRTPNRLAGFSLTELLATIAIIATLIALLLPMLKMVRTTADATRCAANLRQVSLANDFYASEQDGLLCPTAMDGANWIGILTPLLDPDDKKGTVANKLWRGCPDWKNSPMFRSPWKNSWWRGYCRNPFLGLVRRNASENSMKHDVVGGYAETNSKSSTPTIGRPLRKAEILYPAERIWMGDGWDWTYILWASHQDGDRHRKRPGYLFMDGHFARMTGSQGSKGLLLSN